MSSRQISYKLEVDWDGDGTFLSGDDESNNLLNASGNEEISNPVDSAFATGGYTTEATFTLANKARRYSPTNSSSPIYNYTTAGKYYQKKVKLAVTIAGTMFTIFQGNIKTISESPITPDSNGTVTLKCSSGDAFLIGKKATSQASVTKSFYDTGKDEGQLIAQTLSLCGLVDGVDFISQEYGSGTPTISRGMFVIPWYWLDKESPIEDCNTLAAACGGRFYYNTADAKYYYNNAQMYCSGTAGVSQATVDTSNSLSVAPKYNDKEMYKNIIVTVKPRQIGDTTVLWKPQEVVKLLPGQTVTLTAKIDTPVYEFTKLEIKAMTTGGFDKTSEVTYPTPNYNSQEVIFQLTNTGVYHLFLRTFKLYGKPIEGGESTQYTVPASDSTYWSTRNGKDRLVDGNPYIQTYAQAKAIGDLLAYRQGNFGSQYTVKGYKGLSFLKVNYRITVANSIIGLANSDAIITSMDWSLTQASFEQNFELFSSANLYHYDGGSYFKIGTHSQNSGKRYFY